MKYTGIHSQQSRNNFRSGALLVMFPCLVLLLTYAFCAVMSWLTIQNSGEYTQTAISQLVLHQSNLLFVEIIPYVIVGVLVWFVISWFFHASIIKAATGSHQLKRKDNMRIYNLVENLCISRGMRMPKINIIYDSSLNAFASGINEKTYTVTLTRGIIETLEDAELEGVIAHELTHIRNRDVRLLIISIVFVGIFSTLTAIAARMLMSQSTRGRSKNNNNNGVLLLIIVALAAIGYFFTTLMRFAISRKREYMADAGAAEMTKNPKALANALRKISGNSTVKSVKRDDVAQLFIEHPSVRQNAFNSLFATHPPIKKRIEILEQF